MGHPKLRKLEPNFKKFGNLPAPFLITSWQKFCASQLIGGVSCMLLLILLAASLFPTQQASLECVNPGGGQTQAVRGPGGVAAVLKVSTEDDHSKDSHLCNADYQLLLTSADGGAPRVVDFLTSNGDWGRGLSLHLSGFSQDGKRVLGILTEGGKYASTTLIDYHDDGGPVQLIDLRMSFKAVGATSCSPTFEVAGTTAGGGIVVEVGSAKPCAAGGRWVVDSSGGKPKRLAPGAAVLELYER
jgi:hypothetical protein